MSILIVDDRLDNRLLLKATLRVAGFEDLLVAGSAEEAFELLNSDASRGEGADIDVVLMDICMPRIDGIEACRRIKACAGLHDLPVIMVTARDDPQTLERAFEAGALDYVTKPIEPVGLLARVRSACALKRETDQRKLRES